MFHIAVRPLFAYILPRIPWGRKRVKHATRVLGCGLQCPSWTPKRTRYNLRRTRRQNIRPKHNKTLLVMRSFFHICFYACFHTKKTPLVTYIPSTKLFISLLIPSFYLHRIGGGGAGQAHKEAEDPVANDGGKNEGQAFSQLSPLVVRAV